ncbi:MAG: TlpA disulfide reductase family protein [Acidobacteriota bacterium]|nr:TlpA disulfide reductase family protein [Acidobacteriota bacterium]
MGHSDRVAGVAMILLLTIGACGGSTAPDAASAEDEFAALVEEVGPDWEVVEEFHDRQREWSERFRELNMSDVSEESLEELAREQPGTDRAAAAATAILEAGGEHEQTIQAAEFLVLHAGLRAGGDRHAYRGAKALLEHAPDYEEWRMVLSRLDMLRHFGEDGKPSRPLVETFFEELASEAGDSALGAAGRYYLAAGLAVSVNASGLSQEDRAARRQEALEAATGLSAGVEDEEFLGATFAAGTTFADAENRLIDTIRYATVGTTPPELTGSTLDGDEEGLADYRGRVVLVDFWATWCKPCIAALPKLRELVADLPPDRFALLSISVDEKLETVTEFLEDEPMPWSNWHVGRGSEVTETLDVSSYPTYILLDEQGEILARTGGLDEEFLTMIEEAVEPGPAA